MGKKIFHVQSVLGPKIARYFQGWSFFQSKKIFLDQNSAFRIDVPCIFLQKKLTKNSKI